jgi:CheY-like chemotaxis protein
MTVSEDTLRVLVVEDEASVAALLTEFVRELRGEPLAARTAEEALHALESERVDVIVLDLRLPGMSGLDFLRLPAVRDTDVPVVVMSGVATETEAREALQLGAVEFLRKPVRLERLAGILTYLELHVVRHQANWRRLPRATVMFPVQVDAGWEWRALDLSPLGMKIGPQAWLRAGARVRLLLALPDGAPPLTVDAVLVRAEPDGDVFSFENLEATAFERISGFVKRLQGPSRDEPGGV